MVKRKEREWTRGRIKRKAKKWRERKNKKIDVRLIPIFIIKKIFHAMQLHDALPFSSFDVVKLNQLEISHEIGSINLEDPGSISFKLLLRFRVVTFCFAFEHSKAILQTY